MLVRLGRHKGTAPLLRDHEPLVDQALQRLAHSNAADLETLDQQLFRRNTAIRIDAGTNLLLKLRSPPARKERSSDCGRGPWESGKIGDAIARLY